MNWLKIKDFRTLLASLFISKLGDHVYEVVFVFIVLENTHNNYLLAGCVYFFFVLFLFYFSAPLVAGWQTIGASNVQLYSHWQTSPGC
jgi:hypothetical protein